MTSSIVRVKVGQTVHWESWLTPASTTDRIMNYKYTSGYGMADFDCIKNTFKGLKPGTMVLTIQTFGGKMATVKVIVSK